MFGIHPWDVERLTYRELDFYLERLKDMAKQQAKQARSARTGARRGRRR